MTIVNAYDRIDLRLMNPEFRRKFYALVAVAKAARSVLHVDGEGSNTEVPTEYWGALQKLRLAEARLRSVSKP